MIKGLVSIIVPVFNRPRQLRQAVESVLKQDYRPIEVIIVDDGSTDGATVAQAEKMVSENPGIVRLLLQENGGPGVAREHGRRSARGEFIQYLDSDDVLLPGKFSAQVSLLRGDPKADVAYGITYFRDSTGNLYEQAHKDTGIARDNMFPTFLNSRWWETATPLYRAEVCEKAGPWTDLRLEEDWEYDCRVASMGGRLVYCPVPVSEHRDHEGGRLSRGKGQDPSRLRMRAASHGLVWRHAVRAGLTRSAPVEVGRFSRSLFLLARQCGAANLILESRILHSLALEAAADRRAPIVGLHFYSLFAKLFGWRQAGVLSDLLDRFRGSFRLMVFGRKPVSTLVHEGSSD